VIVFVRKAGPVTAPTNPVLTDEEGRFHADDLSPGVYSVSASLNGFVVTRYSPERRAYRISDTVNIEMTKGGVITGTVTTQSGEPVIAARAVAILAHDSLGHATRMSGGPSGWTDDRGVYRIFGLQSGSYLVAINGGQSWYPGYPYEGDVPVYYPSSTRDGAKEVNVQNGQEVSGIDIRYRSKQGHVISGTFTGSTGTNQAEAILINVADSIVQARSLNSSRENTTSFALYGVPDGDYQLVGQSYGGVEGGSSSAARRVTVKGADVTGVELALTPFGSVAGKFTLETLKDADLGPDCKDRQRASVEEALTRIRRDQKSDKDFYSGFLYPGNEVGVTDKGDFTIYRLIAGRYYIDGRFPSEDWYLRSITRPGTPPSKAPIDIAKDGMWLAAGQRLTGVVVTAQEGAASLRGKVVRGSESGDIPANLRVHLFPAEPASADDVVRFAEALVNNDGTFYLTNLAPGRYFIMARLIAEDEWMDRAPRPIVWDASARMRLRQEMEAANAIVDLRRCERVADYALKFQVSPQPKPRSKRTGQD